MHWTGTIYWTYADAVGGANGAPWWWWWCLWGELCQCLMEFPYYSYCRKPMRREFSVPTGTLMRKVLHAWCKLGSRTPNKIISDTRLCTNPWHLQEASSEVSSLLTQHASIEARSLLMPRIIFPPPPVIDEDVVSSPSVAAAQIGVLIRRALRFLKT